MNKVKVETIYVNWHRANFVHAKWPTIAEVHYDTGSIEPVQIASRRYSSKCDLKRLMLALLAPARVRHVICTDTRGVVYCAAIKVAQLKGTKGY